MIKIRKGKLPQKRTKTSEFNIKEEQIKLKAVQDFVKLLPPYLQNEINKACAPVGEDTDVGKRIDELSGTRHNSGKPRISLLLEARHAIEGAADILGDGLNEYGRGNWRKGLQRTEVIDSLSRHLTAYASGEDRDPKTGKQHVFYILCNALFLAEGHCTQRHLDDRTIIDGRVVKSIKPKTE